jgi:adenylosuccinate synthase
MYAIVDLQFGSTGKGLLAGKLAREHEPDAVVTAWAPNAGHTFIDLRGRKYVHRMLANGVVSPNLKKVFIGPGSVIDTGILLKELDECKDHLAGVQVFVHEMAAVVSPSDLEEEKSLVRIGSTMKGTSAAMCRKIRREPFAIAREVLKSVPQLCVVSDEEYRYHLSYSSIVQIEGAQGYSLGINSGFYPYTTSRECTIFQLAVDCALPALPDKTYGSLRTFPIRVANRYNEQGEQVGASGPCYSDQKEITWEEIGVEPEFTTVTKLKRRVFTFSKEQIMRAIQANGGRVSCFVNFVNYTGGFIPKDVELAVWRSRESKIEWVGYGPTEKDVMLY